jgi:hypothetical protein
LLAPVAAWARDDAPSVNFSYLQSLRGEVELSDHARHIMWRVPAASLRARTHNHEIGPPPDALLADPDLISTVDIAWVTLAYLEAAQRHAVPDAAKEARNGALTLVALQQPDGGFPAYQSTKIGHTSSLQQVDNDWMATARAVQALGRARRSLDFDGEQREAVDRCLHLALERVQYTWSSNDHKPGTYLPVDGVKLPAWLPYHRSDVAAALALGFLDWQAAHHDNNTRDAVRTLCDGLVEMQRGSPNQFPWGACLARADQYPLWYADGGLQIMALARAGDELGKPGYISAAWQEADQLHPRLLAAYGWPWQLAPRPDAWPQLAGAAACLAANDAELASVTHKERFSLLAGLFATWFQQPGVLGADGQCLDLIDKNSSTSATPRPQSPASAAQAMWARLQLIGGPSAHLADYTPQRECLQSSVLAAAEGRAVFPPLDTQPVVLPGGTHPVVRVAHDNAFWLRFEVKTPADYEVDLVYVKEPSGGLGLQVRLDGDAILDVPLQNTDRGEIPQRLAAVASTHLDVGPHILGVRSEGLVLERSAVDALVVEPVTPWRTWLGEGNRWAWLVVNDSDQVRTVAAPRSLAGAYLHAQHGWDRNGRSIQAMVQKQGVTMPPQSWVLLEY